MANSSKLPPMPTARRSSKRGKRSNPSSTRSRPRPIAVAAESRSSLRQPGPTIDQHCAYLAAAGIPFEDAQGRRLDFHSMRTTACTLLSGAGALPQEAQALMRHSDVKLTLKNYTDPTIFPLAALVERLPIPPDDDEAPGALAATGTDGCPLDDGGAGVRARGAMRTGPVFNGTGRRDRGAEAGERKTANRG